ncbi:hypothetical protein CE91St41_26170 [Oscillospiraceae bacterium]|nr:hypothetical protein CE91St40_11370 [Oscillospiraceae bacterium]BDF75728.1 hypothetical protein CE91St41_26170 [Oscillospiraceae bacterium]
MDWDVVWKIGLSIIISFGGAGAIIAGTTKFASEKIANRLEKKYELKLSKELESFKNKLEGKSYISKTRFDTEFQLYRELTKATVNMVKEVILLFPHFTRDCRNDYNTYKAKYDLALEKAVIAQDTLAASSAFISSDIYNAFNDIEKKCKIQLGDYVDFRLRPDHEDYCRECKEEYKATWRRSTEIEGDLNVVLQRLREYLATLDIID